MPSPEYPEIFVLRHGQTEWNVAGRHQGRLDSPLTDLGRQHARDQRAILAREIGQRRDVQAFCSPQGRARDTARIALGDLGGAPVIDPRLCEIGFGRWQGLTFDEIAQGWPEIVKYADFDALDAPSSDDGAPPGSSAPHTPGQGLFAWHFQAPGGESFDQMYERALGFLGELNDTAIIVTHGITSRFLRGIWLGLERDEFGSLSGGQGCVYHLANGRQRRLDRQGISQGGARGG